MTVSTRSRDRLLVFLESINPNDQHLSMLRSIETLHDNCSATLEAVIYLNIYEDTRHIYLYREATSQQGRSSCKTLSGQTYLKEVMSPRTRQLMLTTYIL